MKKIIALAEHNHEVSDIVNVVIRKRKDPNNKNSDKVLVNLPLFFVFLQLNFNNKQIYILQQNHHIKQETS